MSLRIPSVLAAGLLAVAGQAQTVQTLVSNGATSNRYDIVILGDGYTAAEQSRFDGDALAVATALFQREPYQTFSQYFNVHTVFRPSLQSGANHPAANPPIVNNPVYGATYNFGGTGRCLYITNTSLALQDAALAPAVEGSIMVVVNDSRYGGCGGTFAVSYNGSSMNEVQIHEFGHSFGSLADEYWYSGWTYTGGEPGEANVTSFSSGQKWSLWLGSNGIGSHQGARYYEFGLYRPKHDCLMRSLGQTHCAVCQEQISRRTNSVVSAIDRPNPAQTAVTINVPAQPVFSFTNLVPPGHNSVITWKVDGATQPATGTSFVLDTSTVPLGLHTVEVQVLDQTPLVRNDPFSAMTHTHTWNVTVSDPTLPDLIVPSVGATPFQSQPGQPVTISTTVSNAGTGPAGSFVVEHFLSSDLPLGTDDIYLGSFTVPSLAGGQSTTHVSSNVQLPYLTPTGFLYLYGVVDRLDQVPEVREDNNVTRNANLINSPPCHVALEYRDDLLYPRNSHEVSLLNGGTALPTVVAPCATPNTQYLIVWGCSGTTPGTTIAPGITVPINHDPCTTLGLAAINGPEFQAFWGTLDSSGIGRASFNWPANIAPWAFTAHFAAVLLDGTPQFTATTNPIEIHVR